FDTEHGQSVDAIIAAKALIKWAEAISAATRVIDPASKVSIDLISAEPACLRFSTILKFVDQTVMGGVAESLEPYPRIKQFVALNVIGLPGAVAAGLIVAFADDPQAKQQQQRVAESEEVQRPVREFYETIRGESAITRVIVKEEPDGPPVTVVERSEFDSQTGLWELEEEDEPEREAIREWDVVVTHPVSIARPLTWGFMYEGLPFRAKMVDPIFLNAIRDGKLPIRVQEGVEMTVRLTFKERREGQIWKPIPGSYRIEEVISPRP
ncbi:hypothetical protein, partial [Erythrobacter sp. MTPC3]|uniref:hypothetical protein n=1 Tax=Erythrobacter sp. MTPC3 TaxID=3056564 RepID=UPI0036F212B7